MLIGVSHPKEEKTMAVLCAGCQRPILDRFLMNVSNRNWHCSCLRCCVCANALTDRCFQKDSNFYCRQDFYRTFGPKCEGCRKSILPDDYVQRAGLDKVYHTRCFTCSVCRKQLNTKEEVYAAEQGRFMCKTDYYLHKTKLQDGDLDEDAGSEVMEKYDDVISEKDVSMGDEDDSRDSRSPTSLHSSAISDPTSQAAPPMKQEVTPVTSPSPGSIPVETLKSEAGTVKTEPEDSELELPSPTGTNNNNNNKDNTEEGEKSDSECNGKDEKGGTGSKRRGPRTTIKAKQLEVLKQAFAATPKPTRHIREQLAQETGLNMRVIQVWFQNRRSKERRMKQLSALGARRAFFRNPRRMRGLQPDGFEGPDMMQPGFSYMGGENGEFYGGYAAYGEYFPGQEGPPNFLPPNSQGTPPLVDHHPSGLSHESQFGPMSELLPPTTSPEPPGLVGQGMMHHDAFCPPRSLAGFTNNSLSAHGPPEMAGESW